MASRTLVGRGTLLALAALFAGLIVLSGWLLRGARVDLTENRLYTIAPGTERLLAGLDEPIHLRYFWSSRAASQYPQLKAYGTRVREFLEELAARSGGNLRLTVIDPEPFSEEEDLAAEFGISSLPVGGPGSPPLYFGLAGTNALDGRVAIPVFDPAKESFLEYDVAKLVYELSTPSKPVVGWLSTLPMSGGFDPMTGQGRDPWVVYAQAQQLFAMRTLEPTLTRVDDDVQVLVVVHPKDLPAAAQFAIDQFALRGGHLIVFVDPIAEQDPAGAGQFGGLGADRGSSLPALFEAWGVDFDRNQVLGDLRYGLVVANRAGDAPVRHIGIVGFDADGLADGDVVSSGLGSVNVATAGILAAREGATTTFEPLLQSSAEAGALPVDRFAALMDPGTLLEGFRPTGTRYAVAARVTGPVRTAFPDGPPEGAALPQGATALAESAKPLNLIVVADTDILTDFLWVDTRPIFGQPALRPFAGNGDFVWNALDNLAGSENLVSVRGRATYSRPFDRVEALRREAEGRFRAKEQELEAELRATEQQLTELEQARGDGGGALLTPEQEQALVRFQEEKLRIRKELRAVRLGLDQEIRALGGRMKLLNIVVAPAIFALLALAIAGWRRRRQEAILLVQAAAKP
jgi:ABC-type uncharacterized transport system involved in gliding motility auxiliary subunit